MYKAALFMVSLMALSPLAWGHKVILDAFLSGAVIEGELGFSNGEMASGKMISVQNTKGRELTQVQTDADGFFTFTPEQGLVYIFAADLGAGHVAQASVSGPDMVLTAPLAVAAASQPISLSEDVPQVPAAQTTSLAVELQKLRAELRAMRRELKAYKEKHDWQTILGGMGYILGLVGLSYYWAARRRLQGK